MNVTFHTLASLATASVLSLNTSQSLFSVTALKRYSVGFILGVLIHGILDFLPHNYPLPSKIDLIFAIILFISAIFLSQKQNRVLIFVCFAGAIFPDIVDLAPGILNKHLWIPVPQLSFKIFPWHWKEYSGSIYDRSRNFESFVYHSLVFLIISLLIFLYRKKLFFVNPQ